jgi:hypothetical protein
MNPAPGISVDFQPCPVWRGMSRVLAAVTVTGLMAWCWGHLASGVEVSRWALVLAATGTGWVGAFRLARASQSPTGRLLWNCADWQWSPADASSPQGTGPTAGTAKIVLDLGAWILIVFRPLELASQAVWLPLRRPRMSAQWHALQCALRQPEQDQPQHHRPRT